MATRDSRKLGTRWRNEDLGVISRRWRVSAAISPQRPRDPQTPFVLPWLAKRLFYLRPAICQTPYERHALPGPSGAALLLASLRALSCRRCSTIERSSPETPRRTSCRARRRNFPWLVLELSRPAAELLTPEIAGNRMREIAGNGRIAEVSVNWTLNLTHVAQYRVVWRVYADF